MTVQIPILMIIKLELDIMSELSLDALGQILLWVQPQ